MSLSLQPVIPLRSSDSSSASSEDGRGGTEVPSSLISDDEEMLPPMEDEDDYSEDDPRPEDEEAKRVNKRKNFRPRNIVASLGSEDSLPLNLSSGSVNHNTSLLPRKLLEAGSPMDLSLSTPTNAAGQEEPGEAVMNPLASLLRLQRPGAQVLDSMKEAFQEILKLYGVPPELAQLLAKNAQNLSAGAAAVPKEETPLLSGGLSPSPLDSGSFNGLHHPFPGLLSGALLSGSRSGPPSSHPPTPPRTPKASSSDAGRFGEGQQHFCEQLKSGKLLSSGGSSPLSPQVLAGILPGSKSADYTRYFKRFGSPADCGSGSCKDLSYREHFHCTVFMCRNRVFAKKEEMIRHAKWHQKLDEAYKYGFRRVTPMDDCTDQFPGCQHNRKQTHYHCIQSESCDKCYISTSDVQMHFNYHRKDNAIQREGFLRFRGHEDCASGICPFRSQKTTHFHCNRGGCQFIFKNKADMEKHKSYHTKDEQMKEDGFRKYTRTEPCPVPDCRLSGRTNHIHCIREACGYVLNSSGQLLTHKRKHERNLQIAKRPPPPFSPWREPPTLLRDPSAVNAPPPNIFPPTDMLKDRIPEDAWRNYLLNFEASEICGFQNCDMEEAEHYHCKDEGCESIFRSDEGVRDHGRGHYLQDQVSEAFFIRGDPMDIEPEEDNQSGEEQNASCPEKCNHKSLHFHCKWENCNEVIFNSESPFKRLEHYKIHEYTRKWNLNKVEPISMTQTTNVDTMFKRKRGRPPKNRVVEVWNENIPGSGLGGFDSTPQAVFTSFKLPKPGQNNPHIQPHAFTNNNNNSISSPSFSSPSQEALSHAAASLKSLSSTPLGGLASHLLSSSPSSPGSPPSTTSGGGLLKSPPSSDSSDKDDLQKGLIKAKGTYYPLSAFPSSMPQGSVMRSAGSPPAVSDIASGEDKSSPPLSLKSKMGVNFMVSFGRQEAPPQESSNAESALAKLLQASKDIVGDISAHPLFGPEPEEESCGRPFCKLKRRPHYHCNFCNQGFTERDKLETHLKKHTAENAKPSIASILHETKQPLPQEALLPKELAVSPPRSSPPPAPTSTSPLPFNFPNFLRSSFGNTAQQPAQHHIPTPSFPSFLHPPHMMLPGFPPFGTGDASSVSAGHGAKAKLPSYDPVGHPLTHLPPNIAEARKRSRSPPSALCLEEEEAKKLRVQAASMKTNKDEPVPEGYMRFRRSFRFNEDCGFDSCNYREHQTHFHCMRKDCNYRFCDKTRFVQHTARHERLDSLCGDEFEGFRGVTCGREACEYNIVNMKVVPLIGDTQKSSSHFHCLKCDYYCTDTNKVVAHRRQHQKLDSIMSAGFEKYSPNSFCAFEGCLHNNKQTHYHCKKCQYSVLGLSQMEAHKYRHLND